MLRGRPWDNTSPVLKLGWQSSFEHFDVSILWRHKEFLIFLCENRAFSYRKVVKFCHVLNGPKFRFCFYTQWEPVAKMAPGLNSSASTQYNFYLENIEILQFIFMDSSLFWLHTMHLSFFPSTHFTMITPTSRIE